MFVSLQLPGLPLLHFVGTGPKAATTRWDGEILNADSVKIISGFSISTKVESHS